VATTHTGDCLKKWALIIDVARCTNCQNCVLATQDEHSDFDAAGRRSSDSGPGADWIRIERRTRGNDAMVDVTYVPKTCNHCENAPCVAAGKGAIRARPDGIVVIDPVKARNRRDLVDSCPYGVISWNEDKQLPQKWSFDADLIDSGWSQPRCTQACPTGAMRSVRLTEPEFEDLKRRDRLEELRPELQTRSRVVYQNLLKATRAFLGGTVTRRLADSSLDNVTEARVELTIPGEAPFNCVTDHFGDFKFDGLNSGAAWTLRVSHPEHGLAAAAGVLSESRYLGALVLDPELVRS
jgi:Fe-S-cluster-containing dehydrogenase component